MNLTLRQLRAFVSVSRLGGFTAAAKRMHLTQSALSALVKELEREVGVRLFDRNTREVVPTEAGREFLPLAMRVLEEMENAAKRVTDIASSNLGIVRVAALEVTSCTLLPSIMAEFLSQNPRLDVRLSDTVLEQVLALVRSGDVDIGIGPEPAPDPELERSPLLVSPFMLACPIAHPLAGKKVVKWAELRGERFVTMIRNFRSLVMGGLPDWPVDVDFASIRETALATTALGMVQGGLGVTVCPAYVEPLARTFGLVLRPLVSPVVPSHLFVFTKRGRSLSPAATRFLAFLRQQLAYRYPGLMP